MLEYEAPGLQGDSSVLLLLRLIPANVANLQFFLVLDIISQESVSSLLLQSSSVIDDFSIRDGFIGSKYRRLGSQ